MFAVCQIGVCQAKGSGGVEACYIMEKGDGWTVVPSRYHSSAFAAILPVSDHLLRLLASLVSTLLVSAIHF